MGVGRIDFKGQGRKARDARSEGGQAAAINRFEEKYVIKNVLKIIHLEAMYDVMIKLNKPVFNSIQFNHHYFDF